MPPQLTETWAGTYLQVIATMLVFALGVPALILQTAPEDLRPIIHRHISIVHLGVFLISLVPVALICTSFVWFLHPCPGSYIANWQHWLAAIGVTWSLFLPIVSWLIFSREYRRDMVIHRLESESTRTIHTSGTLAEKLLVDLIYLGEQSEPGYEKAQVLEALDHLAAQVQGWEHYAGDGLEQLVQGIETILVGEGKRDIIGNFQSAARILGRIVSRLQECGLASTPDMALTLRTLGRLGVAALKLKSEQTDLAFLQAVALSVAGRDGAFQAASETLAEIGVSALGAERFLIAVAILDKLEALAEQKLPLSGEISADFLGLLAHFWTAGETAHEHAQRILSRTEAFFSPSLRECLQSAITHQIRTTQFDTADKLAVMLDELEESHESGD